MNHVCTGKIWWTSDWQYQIIVKFDCFSHRNSHNHIIHEVDHLKYFRKEDSSVDLHVIKQNMQIFPNILANRCRINCIEHLLCCDSRRLHVCECHIVLCDKRTKAIYYGNVYERNDQFYWCIWREWKIVAN